MPRVGPTHVKMRDALLLSRARFARTGPPLEASRAPPLPGHSFRSQACLVLAGSDPKGFELGPSKKGIFIYFLRVAVDLH